GNLFHSFDQFSVPTGRIAEFQHGGVDRIFSRVTGNLPSDIDGTIRAGGSADLFLLNPNGVLFGPNARLDIGGSFFATTAEQVSFADGTVWGIGSNTAAPLLTSTVPMGLQWGGRSGEIRAVGGEALPVPEMEEGVAVSKNTVPTPEGGLSVNPGNTLALVGRSLNLDGAYLTTPGGQSVLAAVGADADVSLVPTDLGWQIGEVTGAASHGAIRLERGAVIDVSGPGGGAVQILGDSYFMGDRSIILADTLGDQNGRGVDVNVANINLIDGSFVSSVSFGSGNAGDINIVGDEISLVGARPLQDALSELFAMSVQNPSLLGSGFFAMGFNTGDSGNISVTATNLTMSTSAFLSVAPSGGGNGGLVDLNIADTLLLDGSEVFADTFGAGRAGDITARARRVVGINGGGLFASTFAGGDGGDLRILATESIEFIGTTSDGAFASGLSSNSYPDSTGTGGLVLMQAPVVRLLDGGLAVAVVFGEGAGGAVVVDAPELLELRGSRTELTNLNTRTQGAGPAGDVVVTAGRVVLADGGVIFSSTLNSGNAGAVTINADSLELIGRSPGTQRGGVPFPSGIRSDASVNSVLEGSAFIVGISDLEALREGLGNAGDVTINVDTLRLSDGSELAVSNGALDNAFGQSQAGDLVVRANRVLLENGSRITADPSTGSGGNVDIQTNLLELRNGSQITTNASGASTGGNIFLDADLVAAFGNSDITANAVNGAGGQVSIVTQGLFGLAFRDRLTPANDITATSQLGAEFEGQVSITTPEVDSGAGLVELPMNLVDPAQQITNHCAALGSEFIAVGRGGLPTDPTVALRDRSGWIDWRDHTGTLATARVAPRQRDGASEGIIVSTQDAVRNAGMPNQSRSTGKTSQLVEASGWQRNRNGDVSLEHAQAIATATPNCQQLSITSSSS
ncbi:MAG: S-layer family protein, partial [Cyanobacteria bacterium P01_D01_bin.73]